MKDQALIARELNIENNEIKLNTIFTTNNNDPNVRLHYLKL